MNTIYNKFGRIACVAVFALSIISCEKEEVLTPSNKLTSYQLPQGNNDFDEVIMDFYKEYGTYMLYKFTDKDAYWTSSSWKNGIIGKQGRTGFIATPAEEAYIGAQIEFVKEYWTNDFSTKFIQGLFPLKLLLCSNVQDVALKWDFSTSPASQNYVGSSIGAWYNNDHICINYGNESILTMSEEQKMKFKEEINRILIRFITESRMTLPTNFTSSVDYSAASSVKDNAGRWALGTFYHYNPRTAVDDWKNFMIMMLCYNESHFYKEVESFSNYDTTEKVWEGLFTSLKDTKGLLRKRYDMVRNYFIENYQMDLQEIGNSL